MSGRRRASPTDTDGAPVRPPGRALAPHYAAALAELQVLSAGTRDIDAVLCDAVTLIARALDVPFCKLLELLPDDATLLVRAGVGWKDGVVGRATVSAESLTQAGYTLSAGQAVIVDDVRHTKIFRGPTMLHEHGLVSGLGTVVPIPGRPYGILSVHTRERRRFTASDAAFLEAAAAAIGDLVRISAPALPPDPAKPRGGANGEPTRP